MSLYVVGCRVDHFFSFCTAQWKMKYLSLIHALNVLASTIAFTNNPILSKPIQRSGKVTKLCGFFDDFLRRTLGDDVDNKEDSSTLGDDASSVTSGQNDEIGLSEKDFLNEIERRKLDDMLVQDSTVITSSDSSEEEREFDGYMLRDAIYNKWGECYDVEFQPVVTFGFRELYLNVMPFRLGGKRFRHKTELDYLCHLQAVVEILEKYDQLDYVLAQLEETKKKPRAGTSPLVAVPFRLSLTEDELDKILRNM